MRTLFGIRIYEGHAAENVGDAQVVVYSSAVKGDNPEVMVAKRTVIPVIPRAEMLAELMALKPYAVAVSGTHGKDIDDFDGRDDPGTCRCSIRRRSSAVWSTPSGRTPRLGSSDWFVTEADESDRSFLMLYPTIAVVTNIDKEHMESYKGMDDVVQCFTDFVNKVPFFGAAIICLDDPNVQLIIPNIKRRRVTYGMTAQADISAHDITYNDTFGSTFTVWKGSEVLGEIDLPVPGQAQCLQCPCRDGRRSGTGSSFRNDRRGFLRFSRMRTAVFSSRAKLTASPLLTITDIIRPRSSRRFRRRKTVRADVELSSCSSRTDIHVPRN